MISKSLRRINYRLWSNDQILYLTNKLDNYDRVINISGWMDKDKEGNYYKDYFLNAKHYAVSNYPNDKTKGISSNHDLKLDLTKEINTSLYKKFNLVLNHTILEHLVDPVYAFKQMSFLTDDLMITVVPWIQQLHFINDQFGDYFRISPMMMRKMYNDNGFEILYENYMPPYANDCYLIYLGSKKPDKHKSFPIKLEPLEKLNGVVGHTGFMSTIINIGLRTIGKFYKAKKITIYNSKNNETILYP